MINHTAPSPSPIYEPKAGDIVFYIYERGNPGMVINVDAVMAQTRMLYTLHVKWLHAGPTNMLSENMVENAETVVEELQAEDPDAAARYQKSIDLLRERFSK